MKTLADWNAERLKQHREKNAPYPRPNGIACPQCGKEMVDTDAMLLLSSPPQRNIMCPACEHYDFRIA